MSARILIVEDDEITAEDLRDILGQFGYTVTRVVSNGAAAIECAERDLPDLALMDIRIAGGMDGSATARALRERFNVPVIYVTAHADSPTIERAEAAKPLGYITKPFEPAAVQASVEAARLVVPSCRTELRNGETTVSAGEWQMHSDHIKFGKFSIVAASAPMKQVMRFAKRVAESKASTILLEGESGTGKDVMAHFLHHFSSRRNAPFVPLNCAAIPETLLESELFGYEKGAFTDARAPKPGLLEVASGGTLFLDEIGEMPVLLQAKMLRVLEEQTFRRLGGVRDIHVDLRLIAASNRKLSDEVERGKFRLDLYYRLNVIRIMLPALRQHTEDIVPLAKHFIGHYARKFQRNIGGISSSAIMALVEYDWPGNVRELRNTIERAVLLEESDWIQPQSLCLEGPRADDFVNSWADEPQQVKSKNTLDQIARGMLLNALETSRWNQTRAAVVLGITRDTLRYKIKKYNLTRPIALAECISESGDDGRHVPQHLCRNADTKLSRTRAPVAENA